MTDQKRKLIFFWPYIEWGGAQIYFLAIIREAQPKWDVIVVLPRASSKELIRFVRDAGASPEFLDFHSDMSQATKIWHKIRRQYRRVKVELASFKYLLRYNLSESILHIEFPPWQSWLFFTALALRRAKVFVTMHNALPDRPAWRVGIWKLRMRFLSKLPSFHLFTSNEDAKNRLRNWVGHNFWKRIKVTYTCVNPPLIKKIRNSFSNLTQIREHYGIDDKKFVVLCVGQFIDRKGRWIFLDAAKIVARDHSNVVFVWLGPVLPSDSEQSRIDEYKLGDNFQFVLSATLGPRHEDVLRFFCVADVFALASYVEGLPIALLEAMALGIPSISTNVYAIPEAIRHLETGLLTETGDANGLAQSILQLKENAELRTKLSANASDLVLRTFDERIASRIALAEYENCFRNAD